MKNLFLSLLLSIACLSAFAQTDTPAATSTTTDTAKAVDTSAMAKVYVIRSTGHVASGVNLRLVVDDVMMCKVRNNRYAVVLVPPGKHLFNATSWDKPGSPEKFALDMAVEAGKTYYMGMRIKQRFVGIEIFLEEVTINTAAPLLNKYKQDACD